MLGWTIIDVVERLYFVNKHMKLIRGTHAMRVAFSFSSQGVKLRAKSDRACLHWKFCDALISLRMLSGELHTFQKQGFNAMFHNPRRIVCSFSVKCSFNCWCKRQLRKICGHRMVHSSSPPDLLLRM